MNDWIDFGFEVEMREWVFVLLLVIFLTIAILSFISALKCWRSVNRYITKKFGPDYKPLKLKKMKAQPFIIDKFDDDNGKVEQFMDDTAKHLAKELDAARINEYLFDKMYKAMQQECECKLDGTYTFEITLDANKPIEKYILEFIDEQEVRENTNDETFGRNVD